MADFFEPGKTISFRLPHDTPKHVIDYLNKLKKKQGRKFSSKISPIFVDAISNRALNREKSDYCFPLPKGLNDSQKAWLDNIYTKELISQMVYNLAADPADALSRLNQPKKQDSGGQDNPSGFKVNTVTASFMDEAFFGDLDDDE